MRDAAAKHKLLTVEQTQIGREIQEITEHRRAAQSRISELDRESQKLKDRLKVVQRELGQLKVSLVDRPVVTEHATLRYIERAMGLNIEELHQKILPDEIAKQWKSLGDGRYPVGDTHILTIRDGVVVTVVVKGD